jgi:transcriptional regulator with XRE-family HTH domain
MCCKRFRQRLPQEAARQAADRRRRLFFTDGARLATDQGFPGLASEAIGAGSGELFRSWLRQVVETDVWVVGHDGPDCGAGCGVICWGVAELSAPKAEHVNRNFAVANIYIGKRLKQVREDAGLNQRDFAARIGSSSGRVSEIESGKNIPGGDLLLRLNQEFGTDLTWLLAGTRDGAVIPLGDSLSPDEAALLDNYRNSPKEARDALKATSAALAQSKLTKGKSA